MRREFCQRLIMLRRNHPAWLLLASRNGPLTLASLKSLIDAHPGGIDFEDAVEHLAESFALHANDPEFNLGDDHSLAARRELRQWLKRGLIVERDSQLLMTDALQRSFLFLDSLEDETMTSTASRLATVQRAIEDLDAQLSHSQSSREKSLKMRIASLEKELAAVQAGEFEVLEGSQAQEGIREVYQLAVSLRADFRRVEDSYREADRSLRQRIISEKQHRGEIVDELLDGNDALVDTIEGQVFENFYQQLVKSAELEQMKQRLRSILQNEDTDKALKRKQKADLRELVSRLVKESERVIQARARSERDVRGFLKSGLADEQIRVGAILQELFQVALEVDWQSQRIRRTKGPLPPVPISIPNLPVVERYLVKQADGENFYDLDFTVVEADLAKMDEEFWRAYRALDRVQLFESTIAYLQLSRKSLTIGELAKALPPSHDLETLAYWLAMAREAGVEIDDSKETIDLFDEDECWTRFHTPLIKLTHILVDKLEPGNLE
ncbi:hypothetical protein Enr10x_31900 [Gimesia panareensis]|uniref:DUF3375 domain-containing protein n=2 Tax=Gimesia panareensis TaxID=2527978 RepID=A0A517Q8A2_9PLAN|nr:hypothetical protein Enr10x_31900 [Gimesia panareensis]